MQFQSEYEYQSQNLNKDVSHLSLTFNHLKRPNGLFDWADSQVMNDVKGGRLNFQVRSNEDEQDQDKENKKVFTEQEV